MTTSDDEDESLARYLESEVLSEVSDQEEEEEEEPQPTRRRVGFGHGEEKLIVSTPFVEIPSELFHYILKFLSPEDLVSCSLVCRFLNYAASDESLWRRLYCMRWGLLPPTRKLWESAWKKLYIQRDKEDMVESIRYCPSEFKVYFIQMQVAKRSQAPLPSQVTDDRIILDKTLANQVSVWRRSRGLTDKVVCNHDCSRETCTYHEIGDVFVCEKTGQFVMINAEKLS